MEGTSQIIIVGLAGYGAGDFLSAAVAVVLGALGTLAVQALRGRGERRVEWCADATERVESFIQGIEVPNGVIATRSLLASSGEAVRMSAPEDMWLTYQMATAPRAVRDAAERVLWWAERCREVAEGLADELEPRYDRYPWPGPYEAEGVEPLCSIRARQRFCADRYLVAVRELRLIARDEAALSPARASVRSIGLCMHAALRVVLLRTLRVATPTPALVSPRASADSTAPRLHLSLLITAPSKAKRWFASAVGPGAEHWRLAMQDARRAILAYDYSKHPERFMRFDPTTGELVPWDPTAPLPGGAADGDWWRSGAGVDT